MPDSPPVRVAPRAPSHDGPEHVAHCPHCGLVVGRAVNGSFPLQAIRCPYCRLLIGAGRARALQGPHQTSWLSGSAAGALANAARREDTPAAEPAMIAAALNVVAQQVGTPVDRLRLLDYHAAAQRDPGLPPLASVLATHETWKAARRLASSGTGDRRGR